MESLNKFIAEKDWHLHSWQSRYGSGVYVGLFPNIYHAEQIVEISTGGDIEAAHLDFYFLDEGNWVPVSKGENLTTAIKRLESILGFNEIWLKAVYECFEAIIEYSDNAYGLKVALDNKVPELFKPE